MQKTMSNTRYITSTKKPKNIRGAGLITVVIVYHSFVSRMKSFGNVAMIPINSKERLIDKHINVISKVLNNYEIIISAGYEAQKIQQYIHKRYKHFNIRCVENTQYEYSSPCESIRLAINNTNNDKIIIINGGIVFTPDLIVDMLHNNASTVVSNSEKNKTLDIGANTSQDSKLLEHISYGACSGRWCEVLYLNHEGLINEARKFLSQKEFKNKIFYELVNSMIQKKININCTNTSSSVMKINGSEIKKD